MPDPGEIYRAVERHRRELLAGERQAASAMVRYYGVAWQRIQDQLADFQRRIAEAKAVGEEVGVSWLFQLGRLESLRSQVEAEVAGFARYAEESVTTQQRAAVWAAGENAQELAGIAVRWDRLPSEAVEDLVGFLSDGSPLRDLLNELPGDAGESVARELVAAVATGQNPRVTARRIRAELGGNLVRALRISRTETMRAYREATHRNYEANADVLDGWVWLAAKQARTCAMCLAMDGSVHKLSERLNDHPNGRCVAAPAVKGMNLPDRQTGAEWFAEQGEATQRKVLGHAGYEAYRAGAVSLQDFVGERRSREWGTTRQVRSLRSILGEEGAKGWAQVAQLQNMQGAVRITQERREHWRSRHPEVTPAAEAEVLPKAIFNPEQVTSDPKDSSVSRRYVRDSVGKWWRVVVKDDAEGPFVLTIHRVNKPGR